MEIKEILGKNLQTLVNQKFTSKKKLAEFLGVSDQAISFWTKAENLPSINYLLELEAIFDMPVRIFCTHLLTYNQETQKFVPGKAQIFLHTPSYLAQEPDGDGYSKPGKWQDLQEKIDLLWRTNLHRAEKMEQTEVQIRELEREIDLLRKEIADLKKAGK